jgi:hypothetical protein
VSCTEPKQLLSWFDPTSSVSETLCDELPADLNPDDELLSVAVPKTSVHCEELSVAGESSTAMRIGAVAGTEAGTEAGTDAESGRRGRPPRLDFWYSHCFPSTEQRVQQGVVASHLTFLERHCTQASGTRRTELRGGEDGGYGYDMAVFSIFGDLQESGPLE